LASDPAQANVGCVVWPEVIPGDVAWHNQGLVLPFVPHALQEAHKCLSGVTSRVACDHETLPLTDRERILRKVAAVCLQCKSLKLNRMTFKAFKEALSDIAELLQVVYADVATAVIASAGPLASGVTPTRYMLAGARGQNMQL
jgi:hypothetical protein